MKKGYCILAFALTLLCVAPVFAQNPTVGVYFDAAGTQNTALLNGGFDELHTAYIVAFSEQLVGGASFKLDIFPRITILNAVYPPGVQIGGLETGIQIGLQDPIVGYFHVPVKLATITLFTGDQLMSFARLNTIADFPNYEAIMLADANGNLRPAAGTTAWLTIPVANESNSWSNVKSLYR